MSKQFTYSLNGSGTGDLIEIHPLTQRRFADASRALAKRSIDWRPGASAGHVEYDGAVELSFQLVASWEKDGKKLNPAAYRALLDGYDTGADNLRAWIVQMASELQEQEKQRAEAEGKNS